MGGAFLCRSVSFVFNSNAKTLFSSSSEETRDADFPPTLFYRILGNRFRRFCRFLRRRSRVRSTRPMESFRSRRRRLMVVRSRFRARRQRFQASLVFVRVLLVKHLHLLLVLRGDFRAQFCVDGVHFFDHFVQFLVACDVIFVLDYFSRWRVCTKAALWFYKKAVRRLPGTAKRRCARCTTQTLFPKVSPLRTSRGLLARD